MKRIISLIIVGIFMADVGCKSSDHYVSPPAKHERQADIVAQVVKTNASGEAQVSSKPLVDIMFVIDDSWSMDPYQKQLIANISRLVDSLATAKSLNVQVAVTNIWDRTRYTTGIVPPTCVGGNKDGSDHVNYIANGYALPVTIPKDHPEQYQSFAGKRFVNPQDPGAQEVLKASIYRKPVLVTAKEKDGDVAENPQCQMGPLVESILEPIHFGLISDYNKDFWRPGSFRVFIVLSDAYEGSAERADSLDQIIRSELKADPVGPQDKYRVYVAGIVAGTKRTEQCKGDPGLHQPSVFPKTEIQKLAELSNGQIFSICSSDYGSQLAGFGDDIKKATLKNKIYKIEPINANAPDEMRLKLLLGTQVLKKGALDVDKEGNDIITGGGDWAYDSKHNLVIVRGTFWNDKPPGTEITISAPSLK
jgi:hypothetical protein